MKKLAVMVFALVTLLAASAGVAQSDNVDVQAAKKEGVVNWYTSLPTQASETMAAMFTKEYGIKVQVNRKGTYGVLQAVSQELQAHHVNVDVVHASEPGAFLAFKDQGVLAQFRTGEGAHFPSKWVDPDGYFYPMRAYVTGIVWNSDALPNVTVSTWADLVKPEFKGKIVMNDASNGGGALYGYYDWKTELGSTWISQLAADKPLLTDGYGPATDLIVSGERPIGPDLSYDYWGQANKGLTNIKIAFPKEGVPLMVAPIAVMKDAPHPAAARLFESFLLSKAAQQAMQDQTGQYSLRDDVGPVKYLPALKDLKIWTTTSKIDYVRNHLRPLQDEFSNTFKK